MKSPIRYVAESFPIGIGMKGERIKKIQEFCNTPEDGYFGCLTEFYLRNLIGKTVISKRQYYKILYYLKRYHEECDLNESHLTKNEKKALEYMRRNHKVWVNSRYKMKSFNRLTELGYITKEVSYVHSAYYYLKPKAK